MHLLSEFVECDHGKLKWIINATLGFKSERLTHQYLCNSAMPFNALRVTFADNVQLSLQA
nr:hypothetical protein [Candidatus Erwinia dacicola]